MATAIASGVVTTATPASAAYPTTKFNVGSDWGLSAGTFTWYNRSVGVQGFIWDQQEETTTQWAQVEFGFGNQKFQTRTASQGENKSFNFTQEGPVGGFAFVRVEVCDSTGDCSTAVYDRP